MGHIVFHRDVICVRVYVMFVTNITVYIQVYMRLHVPAYLHSHLIKVQVAHNFDTFYATNLKFTGSMVITQTKTLGFMLELPLGLSLGRGLGSECITGHIEHIIQNGNRIISLVPLLALEIGYNDHG